MYDAGIGDTDGGDVLVVGTLPQLPNGGGLPSERKRSVAMVRCFGSGEWIKAEAVVAICSVTNSRIIILVSTCTL